MGDRKEGEKITFFFSLFVDTFLNTSENYHMTSLATRMAQGIWSTFGFYNERVRDNTIFSALKWCSRGRVNSRNERKKCVYIVYIYIYIYLFNARKHWKR